MKKLIASALVLGLFTFGCEPAGNGNAGCGPESKYFDIHGVQMEVPKPVQNTDSVKFEHFGLDVSFEVSYYSAVKPRFSLIPAAWATTPCPIPGYLGSQENLADLYLITLADYNQDYRAGDTINAISTIKGRFVKEGSTLQDFIDLSRDQGIKEQNPLILLTQNPDPNVKQAFKLVVKLQNGEEYTTETAPVRIY